MKIRHKITIWVTCAGLLTSLLFSLVIFLEMREQPLELLDSQIEETASRLAGQLTRVSGPLSAGNANLPLISSDPYWIKVYDQKLQTVYQSDLSKIVDLPLYKDRGDDAYTVTARIPREHVYLHQDDDYQVTFRVRVIEQNIAGAPCLIQIARPMEDMEKEASDLLTAIGIGLAASTVLLICASYILAGQIVKPLAAMNRLTREINENTLEKRIPLSQSRDEIYDLATHLNRMFDRLQSSFSRQKQFLADASHELKSPMAMLRLFFEETIQRQDLPEIFHRQLAAQEHNVLRMDRLVKTLLELSILEIKASLTLEPFNLTDLAQSVLADFAPFMEGTNIRLETEIPLQLELWGDRDKINRVFINLFDNAVKYNAAEGLIRLTISETKDIINISVYNSGPGIPKEDLPKVFDQFYRVEKSRSVNYGGAGLGLAIVREIIRLHKGTVSIDSEPGLWTRVDISLPRGHKGNPVP